MTPSIRAVRCTAVIGVLLLVSSGCSEPPDDGPEPQPVPVPVADACNGLLGSSGSKAVRSVSKSRDVLPLKPEKQSVQDRLKDVAASMRATTDKETTGKEAGLSTLCEFRAPLDGWDSGPFKFETGWTQVPDVSPGYVYHAVGSAVVAYDEFGWDRHEVYLTCESHAGRQDIVQVALSISARTSDELSLRESSSGACASCCQSRAYCGTSWIV